MGSNTMIISRMSTRIQGLILQAGWSRFGGGGEVRRPKIMECEHIGEQSEP